jgi:hypothetical protein
MGVCENCGNNYDKSFKVILAGEEHTFDSFECAINRLAPVCEHCDTRVIGHGVEGNGKIYCCAHCAREAHLPEIKDRMDSGISESLQS